MMEAAKLLTLLLEFARDWSAAITVVVGFAFAWFIQERRIAKDRDNAEFGRQHTASEHAKQRQHTEEEHEKQRQHDLSLARASRDDAREREYHDRLAAKYGEWFGACRLYIQYKKNLEGRPELEELWRQRIIASSSDVMAMQAHLRLIERDRSLAAEVDRITNGLVQSATLAQALHKLEEFLEKLGKKDHFSGSREGRGTEP